MTTPNQPSLEEWERELIALIKSKEWAGSSRDYKEVYGYIFDFIESLISQAKAQGKEEVLNDYKQSLVKWLEGEKKNLPYYSRLRQNRNGIEYCGTCEQGWECCTCPAMNSGHVNAIDKVINHIKEQ